MAKEKNRQVNMVEIYIEKSPHKGDKTLQIGINGKNYVLPRGKKTMVPDFVADEIERSRRAEEKYDETSEELLGNSKFADSAAEITG